MTIGIAGLAELTENYINAIQLIQNPFIDVSLQPERAAGWDALILPGGGDIDPSLLPGAPPMDPHCHNIDPELDRKQLALLDLFVQQKKPILGICKGMQLIHLYFGGGFCQHLPTAQTHCYLKYDQLHTTHAEKSSFLFDLYGSDFVVNSAHHQGILMPGRPHTFRPDISAEFSLQDCHKNTPAHSFPLSAIQYAADGVPEGIVHQTLPIIGLQWHPERLCGFFSRHDAVDGGRVFRYFLSLIR